MPVIRAKLTPRRATRVGGIAGLLIAVTLVLSGCDWATVYNGSNGFKEVTVKEGLTAPIIWNCTADHGTGAPRAFCALDTVRALCYGIRMKGVSESNCNAMSNYGDWQDMERAIKRRDAVYQPCLSFKWPFGDSDGGYWDTAGKPACQ